MSVWAVHSDPEAAAELRDEAAYGPRQKRVPSSVKPRVFGKETRLGIWEALTLGFWECKGCGDRIIEEEQPGPCERCQEARAEFRWVWHEPEVRL